MNSSAKRHHRPLHLSCQRDNCLKSVSCACLSLRAALARVTFRRNTRSCGDPRGHRVMTVPLKWILHSRSLIQEGNSGAAPGKLRWARTLQWSVNLRRASSGRVRTRLENTSKDMDFRGRLADFEVVGVAKDVRFASQTSLASIHLTFIRTRELAPLSSPNSSFSFCVNRLCL